MPPKHPGALEEIGPGSGSLAHPLERPFLPAPSSRRRPRTRACQRMIVLTPKGLAIRQRNRDNTRELDDGEDIFFNDPPEG